MVVVDLVLYEGLVAIVGQRLSISTARCDAADIICLSRTITRQ